MSDAIIVAIITGIFSMIGNQLANMSHRKKDAIVQARRDQNLDDRLERLEKKVDLHNEYGKKFGEVAVAMTKMQKDIEYLRKGTSI